jgi:hypothetical protein
MQRYDIGGGHCLLLTRFAGKKSIFNNGLLFLIMKEM